jgi:hypothetical protein
MTEQTGGATDGGERSSAGQTTLLDRGCRLPRPDQSPLTGRCEDAREAGRQASVPVAGRFVRARGTCPLRARCRTGAARRSRAGNQAPDSGTATVRSVPRSTVRQPTGPARPHGPTCRRSDWTRPWPTAPVAPTLHASGAASIPGAGLHVGGSIYARVSRAGSCSGPGQRGSLAGSVDLRAQVLAG